MLICSSQQVWEGFFSQFFPILPLLALSNLGNCCICRPSHCWICFGFYNIYFSWKNHILASQLSGAGEGFSFKVATSKLPKIGKMHIHNCFSCSLIFLCFSQWSCSPNSCRFGPFLMHFHYWLEKNYFDLQLKPICYSDCELARVYDFKERISLGLISYFLCSCLLHLLQLCSVLYTVYNVQCTAMTIILRIGRKRQWVCSKLWTSLVNMRLSLWVIKHVLVL